MTQIASLRPVVKVSRSEPFRTCPAYSPYLRYDDRVGKSCTVTVSDREGKRGPRGLLFSRRPMIGD